MCAKPSVQKLADEVRLFAYIGKCRPSLCELILRVNALVTGDVTANMQQRSARSVVNEVCVLGGPHVQPVMRFHSPKPRALATSRRWPPQLLAPKSYLQRAWQRPRAPAAGVNIQDVFDFAWPRTRAGVLEGVWVQGIPVKTAGDASSFDAIGHSNLLWVSAQLKCMARCLWNCFVPQQLLSLVALVPSNWPNEIRPFHRRLTSGLRVWARQTVEH